MLINIELWMAACQKLNISYKLYHPDKNLLKIYLGEKSYYFVKITTPFNQQSLAKLVLDKEFTYYVLKDWVPMPKTQGFLMPFCEEKYQHYVTHKSFEEIVTAIVENFSVPVIVKKNSGSRGNNVFLCHNRDEIKLSLEEIFDTNSRSYDYIALAQEYIQISQEYRAVFFQGKLALLYRKNIEDATFAGNLSPLHWEGAKAEHITDINLISTIEKFAQPIFQEINLTYCGLDIVIDKQGKYWLIEINSGPGFGLFVKDNSFEMLVDVFAKMLQDWIDNPSGRTHD